MTKNKDYLFSYLSYFLERILDPSKKIDYVISSLYSLFVIILSLFVGVARNIGDFRGYLSSINWLVLNFALPLLLFFVGFVFGKIFPLKGTKKPPLVELLSSESKNEFHNKLRQTLINPYNFIISLLIITCLQFTDTYYILYCYFSYLIMDFTCLDPEKGWAVYFMVCNANVNVWLNLIFVLLAYQIQFFVGFLGILLIVLFFKYNLFFLRHIYQRRWVSGDNKQLYITINLDDPEQCYGFRKIHEGFNYQIGSLVLTAIIIIISRMINVKQKQSIDFYESLKSWVKFDYNYLEFLKIFFGSDFSKLFPDIGQWILLIGWILFCLVTFLPALVKWLPLWPFDWKKKVPKMIVGYIKEFIPEEQWPYGDNPNIEVINILAGKYARNSFWPSGDNRARELFFAAFFAGCFILLPIKIIWQYLYYFIVWLTIITSTSYLLTKLLFRILKKRVRYIDGRLVGKKL